MKKVKPAVQAKNLKFKLSKLPCKMCVEVMKKDTCGYLERNRGELGEDNCFHVAFVSLKLSC